MKRSWLLSPFNLTQNARRGVSKITALFPIYGFKETLFIVAKNTLWMEMMFRLEKDLRIQEKLVEPKIPLDVFPLFAAEVDLNTWQGREAVLKIRGEYGLRQFAERLERGDVLFCAYWKDEFVGFVWLELPPVADAGYPLSDDEAYTHDGWTFEPYRGKRALPIIQQAIFNYLRERRPDIRTVVTHVASWNKPSLAGDQRAGYLVVHSELSLVLFGFHRKFRIWGAD